MANELLTTFSFQYAKGGDSFNFSHGGAAITVTGSIRVDEIQSIATSATAIGIGGIGTVGVVVIVNLDEDNYVTVRAGASGADLVKVKPGEGWPFRSATNTPYAIANTAAVQCRIVVLED